MCDEIDVYTLLEVHELFEMMLAFKNLLTEMRAPNTTGLICGAKVAHQLALVSFFIISVFHLRGRLPHALSSN